MLLQTATVCTVQDIIPEERTEGVEGPIPLDITTEEIAQLISENKHQNVHISDILRLKTKTGERSKAVKIIFYTPRLPSTVQIGTRIFHIEPYRREVKRCTRCQRLDHDKRECRSKQPPRCPKCLQEAHPNGAMECPLPQDSGNAQIVTKRDTPPRMVAAQK